MLNEGKCSDGAVSAGSGGEEDSMYSLVSEANNSEDAPNADVTAGNQSTDANAGAKLGLLILEGLEVDDDSEDTEPEEEEAEGSKQGKASTLLSVPETVFLPSEVGSMAVSGVTHEQNRNTGGDNGSGYRRMWGILREKWGLLISSCVRSSFDAGQLLPLLAMFMAFAAFTSWSSHVWKNEALRLQEELQQQNMLLLETQAQLEAMIEWKERKGPDKSEHEGFFPHHDHSDDEAFLSFKNCYVEASIKLGACSKEWRRWWSDPKSGSTREPEDGEADEYFSYDDGFTDDMSRLMKSFKDTVTSKTTRSYSYIQKALRELSYDGIKETFTEDGYIQSIVQSSSKATSNETGDRARIAEI